MKRVGWNLLLLMYLLGVMSGVLLDLWLGIFGTPIAGWGKSRVGLICDGIFGILFALVILSLLKPKDKSTSQQKDRLIVIRSAKSA